MAGPIDLDATRPALGPEGVPARKKLTLFRLNGEDYKVEARPPASLALTFLDELESLGEERAVARMLPKLLGRAGWEALIADERLTMEEFRAVVQAATKLIMGDLQDATAPLDEGL